MNTCSAHRPAVRRLCPGPGQVQAARPRAGFAEVDLSAAAESVADAYRPDAEEAGHVLIAGVAPGITLHGDQELLTQATANLIENALRHTPIGTRITLHLSENRRTGIELSVEDNGPGVAAEDLPRLVHRFYRGECSRTTPGNGLGLSLVAAVADLHGASLLLEASSPGLRAMLHIPAAGAGQ